MFVAGNQSSAQSTVIREHEIKAVFLLNFAQFAEWPPGAFPNANSPLIIGVLGEDPFGPVLEQAVLGESIRGHRLAIRRFRRVEEVNDCHILFISASESFRTDRIIAHLQNRGTLTVGENEGFARRGGMIRFITENKRIRFRINLEAVQAAGLVLSSKLLRSAEIVPRTEK